MRPAAEPVMIAPRCRPQPTRRPLQPAPPTDPAALLRSRAYIMLLVMGALVGIPVALFSYYFLKSISRTQNYVFDTLPGDLGLGSNPTWWPVPVLMVSGLLVALVLSYLPGTGGHKPAEGFKAGGATLPSELPAVILASFATLALGVVLGPEAPLIAIGSGIGVIAIRLVRKDAPKQAVVAVGAAGSFAAISTLLGSPLTGAFLLMEAAGLGGGMLSVALLPGLLAAGIGALIFVGLDNLTGYGTFSLAVPDIPPFGTPTGAEFLWAIGIGILAALVGTLIRHIGLLLQPVVERRKVPADAGGRRRGRPDRGAVHPDHRPSRVERPLLGPGSAARPDRDGVRLDGRRAGDARPSARGSPTGCRSARSAAARCSPACSSARPSGSRCPTFPGCP